MVWFKYLKLRHRVCFFIRQLKEKFQFLYKLIGIKIIFHSLSYYTDPGLIMTLDSVINIKSILGRSGVLKDFGIGAILRYFSTERRSIRISLKKQKYSFGGDFTRTQFGSIYPAPFVKYVVVDQSTCNCLALVLAYIYIYIYLTYSSQTFLGGIHSQLPNLSRKY